MTLNRWDPFRDLLSLQEKMNRLIDSTVNEGLYHRKACWCPAIDILETPDSYIFRADLPGVGKENINIQVKGNWLTISGERPLGRGWPALARKRTALPCSSRVKMAT